MANITFGGLGTGMATQDIVTQLVKSASAPVARLQQSRALVQVHKDTISAIKGLVKDLGTKARALDTTSEFMAHGTSVSGPSALTAAAGGAASPGTFNVTVSQLAAAQRTYSGTFASSTTAGLFGTGTLGITVGGDAEIEITVDGSTTLASLASDINSSGARVRASIVYDGSQYRLLVQGTEPGSANAVVFDEGALSLGLTNTVQAAQNAVFTVDGVSMQRASNVVNDAMTGVTLSLSAVSELDTNDVPIPTVVTVSADVETMQKTVEDFVAAYNEVAKKLAEQFRWGGAVDKKKLQGDSTLMSLQRQLAGIITTAVTGADSDFSVLSSIGIATQSDGTLKVDTAKLAKALGDDPVAVSKLFTSDLGSTGVAERMDALADRFADFAEGRLTLREQALQARMKAIDDDIERQQARIAKYQARLEMQFTQLEKLVTGLQSQNVFPTGLAR